MLTLRQVILLPPGKFPRIVLAFAALVAAFLFFDLEAVRNPAKSLFFSNSLDLVMVLLAALCSFYVARRTSGYARQLWTLLGVALALQTVAQIITTYYQSFVPGYSQIPLPSDVLFFVWAAPVFMMFLPSSSEKSSGWDWLRILDFVQIAIVAATAFLYFFYVPSRWQTNAVDLPRQMLILYMVRDLLLAGGFFFRSRTSSSSGLRSFSLGLFLVFLGAALTDGDYLFNLKTYSGAASWGDFLYLVPYFLVVLIAVRWKYDQRDPIAEPPSRIGNLAASHVLPLCIPLLVIFMGRRIAKDQVILAWLAVAASFLCAALRLILTNNRQRRITNELLSTEEALRRSEHMFVSAFRSSPDAFSIGVFPEGSFLDVNESFTRLTGYAREEVLGKTPLEINLWIDPNRRSQLLAQLGSGGELRNAEIQFRSKSGQHHVGLLSGALLDLDGKRCALLALRDITDRKAAEELLRSSEERFRSLVERLHVGIASFDPQGRLRFANQAAQDMFGLRLDEIMGQTAAEAGLQPLREDCTPVPESSRPLLTVIATGRPLYSQVFGWRRSHSKEILWTLMDAIPEFDAANNLSRVLVSLTNITEQRNAVEALRESEERFRTLVRDLHVGIILHGSDGTIEFANQAALDIFAVPAPEVLGRRVVDLGLVAVDDQGREIPFPDLPVPTVLRTNMPVRQGTMSWRRPGVPELLWIFGNAIPQFDSDGSILRVISSFTDITVLKNAEKAIHQLSTQLLKLQDQERRRIGRELHDGMAQTVLAVNLSLAQVRQAATDLNEPATRALDKARKLLSQMSREIRTLSYLLHPPLLDDLGLVSALKEYVIGFSERSAIQTVFDFQTPFPRLPQVVETALFRIVQESLANIQRHSGSDSATVSLREDSSEVSLEVTDYGCGMLVPSNGAKQPGEPRLGVGIPGMRERMAQIGGHLKIQSSPSGTSVRATIPLFAAVFREALNDTTPSYPDRG
jgi:PAS domain S-box-containing protein